MKKINNQAITLFTNIDPYLATWKPDDDSPGSIASTTKVNILQRSCLIYSVFSKNRRSSTWNYCSGIYRI